MTLRLQTNSHAQVIVPQGQARRRVVAIVISLEPGFAHTGRHQLNLRRQGEFKRAWMVRMPVPRLKNLHPVPVLKLCVLAALFFLLTTGVAAAGDFDKGLKAFRAGDFDEALAEWLPLAQDGDREAQHAVGMMHEYGRGLERDDVKAAQWYLRAALQNMTEAQYRLGVLRENGWGVARDEELAAHWYEKAARSDHALAQHDLAFMYLDGKGVPKDKVQAYKWLKIASVQRADLMTKHLAEVSKTMTSEEIAKAEHLAKAWLNAKKI